MIRFYFLNEELSETIKHAYEYHEKIFRANKNEEEKLFLKLKLIDDSNAIPAILPLIFSHNKKLSEIILLTIHAIYIKIPIEELELFDSKFRKYFNPTLFGYDISWDEVKALNVEKSIMSTIYAVLCSHWNGYVREKAIKELSFDYLKTTIPALLIRINDWVKTIQCIAASKLKELMNDNSMAFLPFISLLNGLYKKQRYDHSELIKFIENKLSSNCYDQLLYKITDTNKNTSRVAFRIASQNLSKKSLFIQESSKSHDVIIQFNLLNFAKQHLYGDALFTFLSD